MEKRISGELLEFHEALQLRINVDHLPAASPCLMDNCGCSKALLSLVKSDSNSDCSPFLSVVKYPLNVISAATNTNAMISSNTRFIASTVVAAQSRVHPRLIFPHETLARLPAIAKCLGNYAMKARMTHKLEG